MTRASTGEGRRDSRASCDRPVSTAGDADTASVPASVSSRTHKNPSGHGPIRPLRQQRAQLRPARWRLPTNYVCTWPPRKWRQEAEGPTRHHNTRRRDGVVSSVYTGEISIAAQ